MQMYYSYSNALKTKSVEAIHIAVPNKFNV